MADSPRRYLPVREFADRGLKWLLESPQNVRGLLSIVAGEIAGHLDYARMVQMPATLVPASLRKQEADLIFRVPYRDRTGGSLREVLIYLLIEHQSAPDPVMGFRLLSYMVELWNRQRREFRRRKVPVGEWRFLPILPVVLRAGMACLGCGR